MASNGFKKLMLGMEELGHELNQGDGYFDLLYSYIDKAALHNDGVSLEESLVYRAEYYEPKLDKWISYYENNSLDAVKSNLDNPIVGDPRKRIAQYERSGVRKPSYKFVKEVDATLKESLNDTIDLEYKDLEFTQSGNKRDADDWDEFDRVANWTFEVDKNDVYTFIFEDCIDVEDFPAAFEGAFDPNNEDDWNSFVTWLEDNFDEIYSKYEGKILDHWKEDAIEDAEENYEYDPIDYDAEHDDYKFDESIEGDNMKFKVMNEAADNGVENDWEYIQSDETKDDENTWEPLTLWKNKKTGEFRIIIGDYNPWDGFSNFESFDEQEAMDEFDAYLDDPYYNESLTGSEELTADVTEVITEKLSDGTYKIAYYLSTATRERRPETREDIDNDYKEITINASNDFDALSQAFMIQRGIDDSDLTFELDEYNINTEDDFVRYFDDRDWSDGSILMLKVEGPNGVLYDTGYTKQTFIDELEDNIAQDKEFLADMEKEDPEMAKRFRDLLGIDDTVEVEDSEDITTENESFDDDYNFDNMNEMLNEDTEIKRLRHMYGVED